MLFTVKYFPSTYSTNLFKKMLQVLWFISQFQTLQSVINRNFTKNSITSLFSRVVVGKLRVFVQLKSEISNSSLYPANIRLVKDEK